nr:glycosyl hydrolase 115 family protein [uncultured Carboxylicivirga sp.]
MKKIVAYLVMLMLPLHLWADISFEQGKRARIVFNCSEEKVVHSAVEMFQHDYAQVFGSDIELSTKKGSVILGTYGVNTILNKYLSLEDVKQLSGHEEAFLLKVEKNKLIIAGSDKRGTAYGILELSRMMGVSPWVWWADSPIEKRDQFTLPDGFRDFQFPSVARRGIFINDEDWGLTPWANQTYEPSDVKGRIGPETHSRIFELLLRLRANTYWPAMHSCSEAFYLTPGNKEVADKYGIFIGTSHCEPMVCNANAEWHERGEGRYNYLTNKEKVLSFWEERVTELAGSDNIYTLGMRGVHDGPMEGAKTAEEQKEALVHVIKDQRDMLARIVNQDMTKISQVFIPYKEVLEAYKLGLQIPDDVTLMWTDDNYGYIKHFPDSIERARSGGNGIYYHVSYWGRPHDYLWISTNHPAQIYNQMKLAYDKGVREMWVVNVGDIKPAEYLIEFFLDMAWNIDNIENNVEGIKKHLYNFYSREFGDEVARELVHVMAEYYRLAYIRKPEYMGNTRVEERDPKYQVISDLPWSESYIRTRIDQYKAIEEKVNDLGAKIPAEKGFSWFQLVKYPVSGAAEMNKKQLYGQLARHGKADWQLSDNAFEEIVSLTQEYNSLNNGKWNRMMTYNPRNLPVFNKVPRSEATKPMVEEKSVLAKFNGIDFDSFKGDKPVEVGLGYENGAISLAKASSVVFNFEATDLDTIKIQVTLAPYHPVEGEKLRYSISVNDEEEQIIDYRTKGRSEEWKLNVLRNQAIRQTVHSLKSKGKQTVTIKAVDEGVVIDQVLLFEE